MAFITQVSIHGFRSTSRTQHVPLRDLNVLIGPPGTGKTTFIDAIRKYFQIASKPKHKLGPMYDTSLPEAYDAAISLTGYRPGPANTIAFRRDPDNGRLTATAAYLPNHQDFTHFNPPAFYDFTTLGHVELAEREHHDSPRLASNGSNLPTFIEFIRNTDPNLISRIATLASHANPEATKILASHTADYSSVSPGTLKAIALSTALNQPHHTIPPFMAIETPESEQPPQFMPIFYSGVAYQVASQVVITTQNVNLINNCQPEDIIEASRDSSGISYRRPDADHLRRELRHGYDMADLWMSGRLTRQTHAISY